VPRYSPPLDDRIIDGTTYVDAGTVQCFRRDAATTFTYAGEAAAPTANANYRLIGLRVSSVASGRATSPP